MAKETAVSNILAGLGAEIRQAWDKNKGNEIEIGNVDLPPGINGGIAEVTDLRIGIFKTGANKGKPYFQAAARVLSPKKFKSADGRTHRTENQRTSTMPEPLCDTPDRQSRPTLAEHVGYMVNILQICGLNTATLDLTQLEPIFAAVTKKGAKPMYIKFSTFAFKDENGVMGQTNHKWIAPADASEIGGDEEAAVDEDNVPTPAPAAASKNGQNGRMNPKTPVKTTHAPVPTPGDYTDTGDIHSLAESATNGDETAKSELTEMAINMGFTEEQVHASPDWATLVAAMNSGEEPSSFQWEEAGEQDEATGPVVGGTYHYRPIDGKTKKRVTTPVQVEVTSVDENAGVVKCKNTANPKLVYAGVKFDQLETIE